MFNRKLKEQLQIQKAINAALQETLKTVPVNEIEEFESVSKRAQNLELWVHELTNALTYTKETFAIISRLLEVYNQDGNREEFQNISLVIADRLEKIKCLNMPCSEWEFPIFEEITAVRDKAVKGNLQLDTLLREKDIIIDNLRDQVRTLENRIAVLEKNGIEQLRGMVNKWIDDNVKEIKRRQPNGK